MAGLQANQSDFIDRFRDEITICVRSIDRSTASISAAGAFPQSQFGLRLPQKLDNVKTLRLHLFQIPNVIYTIPGGTLQVTYSGVLYNVPLVASSPSAAAFATSLAAALNAAILGSAFTVTYDNATYKFTISDASNNPWSITFVFVQGTSTSVYQAKALGFPLPSPLLPTATYTATSAGGATTLVSPNAADFSGVNSMYLRFDGLLKQQTSTYNFDYTFQLPMLVQPGFINIITPQNTWWQAVSNFAGRTDQNYDELAVSLLDDYGAYVNTNGVEYAFTIGVTTFNQPGYFT